MQPELKKRMLPVDYYTCHDENHFHTNLRAANQCIKDHESMLGGRYSIYSKQLQVKHRDLFALRAVLNGVTYDELSQLFSISMQTIKHNINKTQRDLLRKLNNESDELNEGDNFAREHLSRYLYSIEIIRQLYKKETLLLLTRVAKDNGINL